MATDGYNWYAANATRKYPLDDAATGFDDAGRRLPDDVLADVRVRFPRDLGPAANVSGVTASGKLVTVVFAVSGPARPADGNVPTPQTICAVSIPSPITIGRPYAVRAIAGGVGGWVVFGPGAKSVLGTYRFSTAAQSGLCARAGLAYLPAPVTSLGKDWSALALTGDVKLVGGGDLEVVKGTRTILGEEVVAAIVRLRSDTTVNLFNKYRGPCGRPESSTCSRPGVEFVNDTPPGAGGNLALRFIPPIYATPFEGGGGIALDFDYSLAAACGPDPAKVGQGGVLGDYPDQCNPSSEGGQDVNAEVPPPDLPSEASLTDYSSYGGPGCDTLPACLDFSHASWRIAVGPNDIGVLPIAAPTGPCGETSAPISLIATTPSTRSVALWDDCAYGSSLNLRVTADVYLPEDSNTLGGRRTGGVVVNFRPGGVGRPWDEYFLIDVDSFAAAFRIRRWTGAAFAPMATVRPLTLPLNAWYRIVVETTPGTSADKVRITGYLYNNPGLSLLGTATAETVKYLPATGRVGVGREVGASYFARVKVEEI